MRAFALLAVGFSVFALACGDDAGGGASDPDTVTRLIGTAGGTVELADGAKLVVPPGALTATTEIKITKLELDDVAALPMNLAPAGKPYAFEPFTLVFALPVKLEVPFDGEALEVRPMKLPNRDADTPQWVTVFPNEKADGKVSGELTTLGVLLAARPNRTSGVVTLPDGAIADDAGLDGGGMDAAVDAGRDAAIDDEPDAETGPTYPWLSMEQFGTVGGETAAGVAVDGNGDVFIAGTTSGQLPGQTSVGYEDAFVIKRDASGTVLWTRQFGTADSESADGVAVDGNGNVFVVGSIYGAFAGQTPTGFTDIFVRKYNGSGVEQWTRQFGTSGQSFARGVAVDGAGNVFVSGTTGGSGVLPGQSSAGLIDCFVRKYDGNGTEQWTRQFGTNGHDYVRAVAADAQGAVFVVGVVDGALPGQTSVGNSDAFLRKYDASGAEVWTRQFGTTDSETAEAVALASDGSVIVAGVAYVAFDGQTSYGDADVFVRKFDSGGIEVWTRQFGTAEGDLPNAVTFLGDGSLVIAGTTRGSLVGQVHVGGYDAFLRKYDGSGTAQWTQQFGTPDLDPGGESDSGHDEVRSVAVGSDGNLVVVGTTTDSLPGQTNLGGQDAFIARFAP